jgi:hypothetical protein
VNAASLLRRNWRQDAAFTGTLEARRHTVEATILLASQRGFQPRDPGHGAGVKVASCRSPEDNLHFRGEAADEPGPVREYARPVKWQMTSGRHFWWSIKKETGATKRRPLNFLRNFYGANLSPRIYKII